MEERSKADEVTPPPVLFDWLERIGLGYAVKKFEEAGCDTPQKFHAVEEKDLDRFGVQKEEDRRKLLELVEKVRNVILARKTPLTESSIPEDFAKDESATIKENKDAFEYAETMEEKMRHSENKFVSRPPSPLICESDAEVFRRLSNTGSIDNKSDNDAIVKECGGDRARVFIDEVAHGSQKIREDADVGGKTTLDPSVEKGTEHGYVVEEMDVVAAHSRLGDSEVSEATSSIRVCVRKRPLSAHERKRKEKDTVEIAGKQRIRVHEPRTKVDLTSYVETYDFAFDEVFGEKDSTELIYHQTTKALVGSIFRGGRATCFAYGQTGSGKTYTMLGADDATSLSNSSTETGHKNIGLYALAARDIFTRLSSTANSHLEAHVSFYEIYGNGIYDLLNSRRKLRCMENHCNKICIIGLAERRVATVDSLFRAIACGTSLRKTGSTGANLDSSRSHAILQISLKSKRKSLPGGKISFIDLAGSERGKDTTHNDRQRRLEGAEINKSLLALKECIRALHHKNSHTPFRGSKLTQVLKDSFIGGGTHTVMIATIAPNAANCEHSLNTLRYAYRVKEIEGDSVTTSPFSAKSKKRGAAVRKPHATAALPPPPVGEPPSWASTRRKENESESVAARVILNDEQDSENISTPGIDKMLVGAEHDTSIERKSRLVLQEISRDQNGAVVRPGTDHADASTHAEVEGAAEEETLADVGSIDDIDDPLDNITATTDYQDRLGCPDESVRTMLKEESRLLEIHRGQIKQCIGLLDREMSLVDDMELPDASIETYVRSLRSILNEKERGFRALKERLDAFEARLVERPSNG
eukprot:g3266.t1